MTWEHSRWGRWVSCQQQGSLCPWHSEYWPDCVVTKGGTRLLLCALGLCLCDHKGPKMTHSLCLSGVISTRGWAGLGRSEHSPMGPSAPHVHAAHAG